MTEQKINFTILSLFTGLFALGLIIPFQWIKDWDNYQFILMAGLPALYFLLSLLKIIDLPIQVSKVDLGWGAFLVLCFTSYWWATNGSLIWYPSFVWLSLICWMLLFKSISINLREEQLFFKLFIILFFALLIPFGYTMILDGDISWFSIYGYRENFLSGLLVCLYPFLLFYKSKNKIYRGLLFIGTLFFIWALLQSEARGNIIAAIGVFFFLL
ncbi:MAG: hypothetical protein AB8G22_08905, partial [Saprospiraceae bacterium]